MKTSKTISNISYNSPAFFESKVNDLVQRGVIEWCYWILHKADIDELKNHIHFVLKPCKAIDTHLLRSEFNEFDPKHPDKPLTCTAVFRPVLTGHMDDWLLYAVHDPSYLASKGQKRNVTYSFDDLKSTDYDALRFDWTGINRLKFTRIQSLVDAVRDGMTWMEILNAGIVPMANYNAMKDIYHTLMGESSGRKRSHDLAVPAGSVLSNDPEQIAGQLELSTAYRRVGSATVGELEAVIDGMSFEPEQMDVVELADVLEKWRGGRAQ